jgi:agmatine deiminase
VWGDDLDAVQDTIERIALAIAEFEPVTMLCRPDQLDKLAERTGGDIELLAAPVDDLWARDTLPCLLVSADEGGGAKLAAGRFTFNGWGRKQVHDGDTQLAAAVAQHLGIELIDSGIVGEGGGLEVDGEGTVLASRSSWVNDNRNPGRSEAEVEASMLELLGAERMIWVDGLAGADITDGHIDTLARFAAPTTIVVDVPAFDDPDDPWVEVAESTRAAVEAARTLDGERYEIVEIVQPEAPRGQGDDFLATYMNYYVCNGAVIAPEFGDPDADEAAREVLQGLFPDREIVMIDIDPVAAGGGGIHWDDIADAALTVHTIYFMDEPATTLAEIARVLRPGGTLALACVVSDDGLDPWKDPTVYRTPSINDIHDHFATAGFVRVEHRSLDQPSGVHLFFGRAQR